LLIASVDGLEQRARAIGERLETTVATATSRRDALAALRDAEFGVVVVEESLVESDPGWADQVWDLAGYAVPIEINLAISGSERVAREVKAALARRDGEQALARKAVSLELESEFKSSLTGLLLHSELALREPSVPPALALKLRYVAELAGEIRERLKSRR
jgi:hypothetical protein